MVMMKKHWALVVAVMLTALAIGLYQYRGYLTPMLPATVAASVSIKAIQLPPGFTIHTYAANVPGARSMTLGPSGTLFVGTRRNGKVYAIPDTDGDFQADRVILLFQGLNMPNGVAVRNGDLYVAEVNRILRFPDIEQRLENPPEPEVISTAYPTNAHHGWKFIAFGPDGKLYVPVGAPCNICRPEKNIFATITRMNPDGSGQEIVAYGIRNSVGFDWHPKTGELWFTDNGRDWLGENSPPDELNTLSAEGMHFGYPYCHGKGIVDPDYGAGKDCRRYIPPTRELGPHVAALGMRFYDGSLFPENYRSGLFIAEHGSWNRKEPIGYREMFVSLEEGKQPGYEVFAEGWLENGVASGRPVDVEILHDGSLLVSDDKGGHIYRITYNRK